VDKNVSLRELNQHTSSVIHQVADDHDELTVTRGGTPVARIVPISSEESLLSRWVSEGRTKPPTRAGPMPAPMEAEGPDDLAQTLAEDRENERW
jgi:prevent-host-death family protein